MNFHRGHRCNTYADLAGKMGRTHLTVRDANLQSLKRETKLPTTIHPHCLHTASTGSLPYCATLGGILDRNQLLMIILGAFFFNGPGRPGPVSSRDRWSWPNRSGLTKKDGYSHCLQAISFTSERLAVCSSSKPH